VGGNFDDWDGGGKQPAMETEQVQSNLDEADEAEEEEEEEDAERVPNLQ